MVGSFSSPFLLINRHERIQLKDDKLIKLFFPHSRMEFTVPWSYWGQNLRDPKRTYITNQHPEFSRVSINFVLVLEYAQNCRSKAKRFLSSRSLRPRGTERKRENFSKLNNQEILFFFSVATDTVNKSLPKVRIKILGKLDFWSTHTSIAIPKKRRLNCLE